MREQMTKRVNTVAVLGAHICWAALDLFISTFLIAQILFETDGDIGIVALFYLVNYAAIFIFYAAFVYIVKRYSAVWCMRVGVLINVVLVCLVCVFNNRLVDLYLVFGALCGTAAGIYWIAINGFTANIMGGTAMLHFQIYYNIALSAAKIILPFTLGILIYYISFFVAAIVAVAIGVVLVVFTLLMRECPHDKAPCSMTGYFRLVRREGLTRPVMHNFFLQFLRALFECSGLCVVILVALHFGNSFSLGYLISIFAAGAIVMLAVYRLIKSRPIKNAIHLCCAVLALGLACSLLFSVSKLTIILFQFSSAVLLVVPRIEASKLQFDVMKDLGHGEVSLESLVFVELAFLLGRLTVVGLILLGYHLESFMMFRILAVALIAAVLAAYVLFRLWWRAYRNVIPRAPIPARRRGTPKA